MAGLEDFTLNFNPTLEDFVSEPGSVNPVVSGSSNLNIAAHTAALSGDPTQTVDTYRRVNAELSLENKSNTSDDLVRQAREQQYQEGQKGLIGLLSDSTVSDEDKRAAANQVYDQGSSLYNPRNILSARALQEPSGPTENVEQEVVRVNLAQSIEEINNYKLKTQAILNRTVAEQNPESGKVLSDVIDMFTPFVEQKFAATISADLKEGKVGAYAKAIAWLGDSKMDLKEMLVGLPVDKRLEMTDKVVQAINANSAIVAPDSNEYAKLQYLRLVLDQGSYDDTDKWIDNITSMLDLTLLGGVAARMVGKAFRGGEAADNVVRDIERQAVRSQVQPTTISQNYKDMNPEKAVNAHEAAAADETGEAAEALYGTSRVDAVGNDLAPEISGVTGGVRNKVGNPGRINDDTITPNPNVMDFVHDRGDIFYDKAEKITRRAAVVNDFQQAHGLVARKEMFNIESLADGVGIKAIYGPPQGGFSSAQDAVNMAEWAMRDYGVPQEAISFLKRQGSEYVPVGKDELATLTQGKELVKGRIELRGQEPSLVKSTDAAGNEIVQTDIGSTVSVKRKSDYLIQVDHKYQFSPADMTKWSEFDVNYNIFDRIFANYNGPSLQGLGVGSLQRHVVDAASMFRPEVTKGASVAVDRAANLEKKLIEVGDDFAKTMKGLSPSRQTAIDTVIREANERGLDLDYTKMVSQGFRPTEIQALRSWREYWDTVYHLENADAAKSLRNRGFEEFIDHEHDTKLFAKPVGRNNAGSSAKVYDHTTGEIRNLNKGEITELYAKNGNLARLRSPIQVGDDAAELIVNPNAAGKAFSRRINDDSEVLAYRKGYYSVNYTDPHFIIKKVKNSKGELLYEKAVATAKTKKQADILTARLAATDGAEYYNRTELKKGRSVDDDTWDVYQARGRSAQRSRGQRLEDTTSAIDPSQANIMSPVEALVHSAGSIARRVEMRDMIDAGKLRAKAQYAEFFPDGKYGDKVYPGRVEDIQYRGEGKPNNKKLADARSTFEYFRYLEDGYINHIDDTYKVALKFLAEVAGNKHLSRAEAAARWMGDARGPAAFGKSVAFNLYLALNPLRQFVVQGHQAVQLFAVNPKWFLTGRATPQTTYIAARQLGIEISPSLLKGTGWTKEMADKVYKDFQNTGLVANIDKQNLVRGSLLNLADQTIASKTRNRLSAPLTASRKIGFDAGEYVNTVTSYLSHYDQAFLKGADLKSQEVLQNIAADSRNFTYNMNSAGDLPYNQNALNTVFQFMQVPHKALLTMTTNRNLTAQQKIRLAGFNAVMYTLPPAAMYTLFGGILPDDPEVRDVVVQGLEGAMLNKLLSLSTGEESNIDFSGLAPIDMFGTYEFIHSLFSTDVGTVISSTPSGQLLFGNNPRITNFAKTAAKYFNLTDDYTDPVSFSEVATEFAKLSSGMSNIFKAGYALKYGQKINTMGGVTDPNVTTPTAIAQVFGFGSMTEAQSYYVKDATYKKSKAFEDDVKKWYGDYKKHLVRKGISPQELEGIQRVYTEAWRHFGNDDFRGKQIINQLLRQDVMNGDARMYQNVLRSSGIMSTSELQSLIKALPNIDEEKRQQLKDTTDFIQGYKDPETEN
ncbi:hypothetical protein D3C84_46430 [compost metagenome]